MFSKFSYLFIFFIILLSYCTAEEREDAFYAVSSLRFFIDQSTSENEDQEIADDKIIFKEKDIESLWSRALTCPETYTTIQKARLAFDSALFERSEKLLYQAWRTLHPDIPKTYQKNMQKRIAPFLISPLHSAKHSLDMIFASGRPISNEHTLAASGFTILFNQSTTHIIVAKHGLIQGYLMKLYLDIETRIKDNLPGWEWFARRCEGARNVRELINRKNLKHFSVPDKSIYPVPRHTPSQKEQAILVVTDMQLCSYEETCNAWYHFIGRSHLDELYSILSHGYSSAFLICNIPLTKSGKFACVDTEHPKRKIKFSTAKRYINPEMGKYWDRLVTSGGKRK
ncbi:MAG: hypothetical protein WC222_10555 [Parachlamydiales bacterium]|jgi:hypothetical protein